MKDGSLFEAVIVMIILMLMVVVFSVYFLVIVRSFRSKISKMINNLSDQIKEVNETFKKTRQ